jgi:hypothetical protein
MINTFSFIFKNAGSLTLDLQEITTRTLKQEQSVFKISTGFCKAEAQS